MDIVEDIEDFDVDSLLTLTTDEILPDTIDLTNTPPANVNEQLRFSKSWKSEKDISEFLRTHNRFMLLGIDVGQTNNHLTLLECVVRDRYTNNMTYVNLEDHAPFSVPVQEEEKPREPRYEEMYAFAERSGLFQQADIVVIENSWKGVPLEYMLIWYGIAMSYECITLFSSAVSMRDHYGIRKGGSHHRNKILSVERYRSLGFTYEKSNRVLGNTLLTVSFPDMDHFCDSLLHALYFLDSHWFPPVLLDNNNNNNSVLTRFVDTRKPHLSLPTSRGGRKSKKQKINAHSKGKEEATEEMHDILAEELKQRKLERRRQTYLKRKLELEKQTSEARLRSLSRFVAVPYLLQSVDSPNNNNNRTTPAVTATVTRIN